MNVRNKKRWKDYVNRIVENRWPKMRNSNLNGENGKGDPY
jgi:hypothetical protein